MLPLTLDDAIAQIVEIPAIAQLYEIRDRPYLESLLALNIGSLKVGGNAYRIFAAAATYIGSHPQVRFLSTHDGTKIGDVDALIESLNNTQAKEDAQHFTSPGSAPLPLKYAPPGSYSLRGFSEP